MLFRDMTDEYFLSFLTIAVANINYGQRPNRKTQIDLRTYWQGLSGLPITARAQVANHYLTSISNWEAAAAAGSLCNEQPQNQEEAVEYIRKSVLNQAIRRNANISRSTSTTSNFMEQEESAFYAYIISEWDFIL